MRGGFLRAMSDAGLKPTVVYHNLTPAELYEKVRLSWVCTSIWITNSVQACQFFRALSFSRTQPKAREVSPRLALKVTPPHEDTQLWSSGLPYSSHQVVHICCGFWGRNTAMALTSERDMKLLMKITVICIVLVHIWLDSILQALQYEPGSHLVASGALATLSGAKTGRCPKDKRVVKEETSEADIWWSDGKNGSPNYEMDARTFLLNRERAVDYLNMLDRIYVFDGFAGWEPEVKSVLFLPRIAFFWSTKNTNLAWDLSHHSLTLTYTFATAHLRPDCCQKSVFLQNLCLCCQTTWMGKIQLGEWRDMPHLNFWQIPVHLRPCQCNSIVVKLGTTI